MKPLLTLLALLCITVAQTQTFKMIWETTAPGQTITIPTFPGETYNYSINWGDGVSQAGVTGDVSHVFSNAGNHTITISGTFPRIYFNNTAASKNRILEIKNWGNIVWSSMENAFYGCTNLNVTANNAPNLTNVTSTRNMFRGTAINSDLSNWDVSTITDMSHIFREAILFNGNITNWDTSAVQYMQSMFRGSTAFNQDISNWDVSNVISTNSMFREATSFNQNLANWDISSLTFMGNMFLDTTLSTTNYDNTLIGWATLDAGETQIPSNITFHGGNSNYCHSATERQALIDAPNNWTITDGGQTCNPFIITIETTSDNENFTIPTTGSGYNYLVNWGDGSFNSPVTGNISHSYALAGTYTVTIAGNFPHIYFNNNGDKDKIQTVEQWGDIAWSSMANAFEGCTNLTITATDAPNLSNVNDMSNMFRDASSLNQDISHWDVSNVTNMLSMFQKASSFNQPLNNWNTSSVTHMNFMFNNASAFNQPLNNWNTSNVTNMRSMFSNASTFNQPLNNWNTSNVTNMSNMFNFASAFNQPLNNWNTSNVTNMNFMFANATSFDQDISSWNVNSVGIMGGMFSFASAFNQPLNNWNTSNVTNMNFMFDYATSFDQDLSTWDISSATNMTNMFLGITLSNVNYDTTLIGWATDSSGIDNDGIDDIPSGITNFHGGNSTYCIGTNARDALINTHGWTNFTDGGQDCSGAFITTWQTTAANEGITIPTTDSGYSYSVDWGDGTTDTGITGNVTHKYTNANTHTVTITGDFPRIYFNNNNNGHKLKIQTVEQWGDIAWSSMANAFYGCENLTITATDAPNLSNVTDMSGMFRDAKSLNQNINSWDVSNVTDMSYLFQTASVFNQPLNNWDVSSVTNMFAMFSHAFAFNQPLNNWNVSNVTNMNSMFRNAKAFNQNINSWNISNVINISFMFGNAKLFNQPLDQWDVSNLVNVTGLFAGASAFNQNINSWDVSNLEIMTFMFNAANAFNQPLDQWDVSNVRTLSFTFWANKAFNQNINSWDVSNVTNMSGVFNNATSFNQPLDQWDVSNVTTMSEMFKGATLSTVNYDATLIGWATLDAGETQIPLDLTFHGGSSMYCDNGETARNTLINTYNWTINDGGKDTALNCTSLSTTENSIESIYIYPNPTVSTVFIENTQNIELKSATIFDITGKQIIYKVLDNSNTIKDISLKNLPNGLYLLKLESNSATLTKRIIKQ